MILRYEAKGMGMKKEDSGERQAFEVIEEKTFICDSPEEAKAMALGYIAECGNKQLQISRPKIPVWRELLGIVLPLLIYAAEIVTFVLLRYNVWIFVGAVVLTFFVFLKPFFIVTVLNYQKFAPEELRRSCLFTPTCSEYMLLAIDKYGFIKGVIKGVKRLLRCHPPNGGVDYP